MNCNICHYPNDEDNTYCEGCGIKLLPSVAGEVWRAKDVVYFFSDSEFLSMNLPRALAFSCLLPACALIVCYYAHWPLKYSSLALIGLAWTFLLRYRDSHKMLKSLSLADRNKVVELHGPASLVGPAATIGGWLYLTPGELLFTPESYFVNSNVLSVPFSRVRSKSTDMGFSLTGDQFQIITTEGQEFVFSVYNRDIWSTHIDSAMSQLSQSHRA